MANGTEPLRVAVLGSGKGSNCQSIFDAIDAQQLNVRVVCVASDVEDAFILQRAAEHKIPAQFISALPFKTKLDGKAEEAYIAYMRSHGAQVVALAGFMRIIKPGLLAAFPRAVINIHPSLLPAFPGLEAWKQALDYGVKVTGCTVHFVDAGMDTGPVIVQKSVPVLDDDTPQTLHARIQVQEHIAYPEALSVIAARAIRIDGRKVLIAG
ncbi:MAG: phosphoribosylglycinamide formyltransferase [Lentisphaerales bacterium]|nr:MAG: phosphoribosylglycinamide formyltransferase [Lentisphaerales bacterium]